MIFGGIFLFRGGEISWACADWAVSAGRRASFHNFKKWKGHKVGLKESWLLSVWKLWQFVGEGGKKCKKGGKSNYVENCGGKEVFMMRKTHFLHFYPTFIPAWAINDLIENIRLIHFGMLFQKRFLKILAMWKNQN